MTIATLLLFASSRGALADDPCTISGPTSNILTCTGDQSDGVGPVEAAPVGNVENPPYDTLIVNSTTVIQPASGDDGVNFTSATGGALSLDVTGTINVDHAQGIFANSRTLDTAPGGDVTVVFGGTLVGTGDDGIEASTDASHTISATSGSVAIFNNGFVDIQDGTGVYGSIETGTSPAAPGDIVSTAGDIHIESRDVKTVNGTGINAYIGTQAFATSVVTGKATATGGDIEVISTGAVTADNYGINANAVTFAVGNNEVQAISGEVSITAKDVVTPTGSAIYGSSDAIGQGTSGSATSGRVTITTSGTISAAGLGGVAIRGSSGASGTAGVTLTSGGVEINVLSGSVTGGSGTGAAVVMQGQGNNRFYNAGSISALSGLAVRAGNGIDTVDNEGLITGNIDLGSSGPNSFNNLAAGTFQSGDQVLLGSGLLHNEGIISPGGTGSYETTNITGNFGQQAGGKWYIDADWAVSVADVIDVTGSAGLNGTVIVFPVNFPTTAGLSNQFLILHADNGATNNGITAEDTATVDYEVVFDPNGRDVFLRATIDFAGVGTDSLNPNQTAIAENINDIITAGGSLAFSPVAQALMTLPTQEALANALDQLSPEIYNYQKTDTLFAAEQFSSDLLSCRVADGSGYSFIHEGQCIWARARARFLDLDTTDNIGADSTTGSFSGGGQVAVAPDWRLGFAAGYDTTWLDTGTGASAEGDRANVGGVLKYNPGPLLVAGAVSGGWTSFDTTRNMAFGGFAGQASGDSNVDYFAGRVHLAYLLENAGWYLKPMVDGTATQLDFDGVTEAGGGGAALILASGSDTFYAVSPALEIGSEFRFSQMSVLRPFIRAGVTWRDGDDLWLNSQFGAAPVGVAAFATNTALDDVLADVSAGFDLINTDGAALRLQYDGRFGEETQQNSASIKGSVPF